MNIFKRLFMQKPFSSINYIAIGICILSLIVGFVIGKYSAFEYFIVDDKVNLVALIQLGATFFISYVISRSLQTSRSGKDLIIKKIDKLDEMIKESYKEVSDGSFKYTDAAAHVKRINTQVSYIYDTLPKLSISINAPTLQSFFAITGQLRDLLTETPVATASQIKKSNLPIEVKGGMVKLASDRVNLIKQEFDKLNNELLLLQVAINKA